jgi:hypothetical protein
MIFWIGVLIAAGFAYSSIKLGLYQAWTLLFNILIAVYLGVRLGPTVEELVPMGGQYCRTLAVLATGLGTFLVLHGISYSLLIGQFEVTFPRGVNMLGSGLLGFLAGFLLWSFAMLVMCTTPFCEKEFMKEIGFSSKGFEETRMKPYLAWWCNLVDKLVAVEDSQTSVEQTINNLLTKPSAKKPAKGPPGTGTPADANEPNYPPGFKEQPITSPPTEIPP